MNKKELEQKLNEIHAGIISLGDFQQKNTQADALLQSAQAKLQELEKSLTEASKLFENAKSDEEEVNTILESLKEGTEKVSEYAEIIPKQKEEFEVFKAAVLELRTNYSELETSIRDQLGVVSMESLANSFATEAKKLDDSSKFWLKRIFWTAVALVLAILGVSIWQVTHEQSLLKFSFLLRLPLVSPIIYYLYFVTRQYTRDKRLLEEYNFKSSVARSFEAYRKVIKEEISETEEAKKTEFVLGTVKDIYSSPMYNIRDNHGQEPEEKDGKGVDLLDKLLDTAKKFKDILIDK